MRQQRRRAWRGVGIGLTLVGLILAPSLIGLARAVVACRMWETPAVNDLGAQTTEPALLAVTQPITDYARLEDATYLTLPEWYVVYSTDEYAAFIAEHPPSQFPYFQAANQFWESWLQVCEVIHGRYPLDGGYQFALVIIGVNFTTENIVRGSYEFTLGRLAEWTSTNDLTEEDAYARVVAKEYGDFIHMVPWFDFPFTEKLRHLWAEISWWGPNPIRKWERKISLSLDYGVKAFYGWLIARGADAVYGGPDKVTIYAVAEGVTPELLAREPELARVHTIGAGRDLITLTRFEVFSRITPGLLQRGLRFVEIAGNDEILLTAFAPRTTLPPLAHAEYLFDLPLLTDPARTRVALKVRVSELHLALQELAEHGVELEHIYDY